MPGVIPVQFGISVRGINRKRKRNNMNMVLFIGYKCKSFDIHKRYVFAIIILFTCVYIYCG